MNEITNETPPQDKVADETENKMECNRKRYISYGVLDGEKDVP